MRKILLLFLLSFSLVSCKQIKNEGQGENRVARSNYTQNRAPLNPIPYQDLPLGLLPQRDGLKNSSNAWPRA